MKKSNLLMLALLAVFFMLLSSCSQNSTSGSTENSTSNGTGNSASSFVGTWQFVDYDGDIETMVLKANGTGTYTNVDTEDIGTPSDDSYSCNLTWYAEGNKVYVTFVDGPYRGEIAAGTLEGNAITSSKSGLKMHRIQ